jgi:hypothetical protein
MPKQNARVPNHSELAKQASSSTLPEWGRLSEDRLGLTKAPTAGDQSVAAIIKTMRI